MQLIQDGKINLDDPVLEVHSLLRKYEGRCGEKRPRTAPRRSNWCLLPGLLPFWTWIRHTSGITYGCYGDSLVRKAYKEANIYAGDFDLAEFAERIAKLPLHNQPGALWQYGHSTDILARVQGDRVPKIIASRSRRKSCSIRSA